MLIYGLTNINWLSSNLEEFIEKCEKRVDEGVAFLEKVNKHKNVKKNSLF
jgi:hypothetical protein